MEQRGLCETQGNHTGEERKLNLTRFDQQQYAPSQGERKAESGSGFQLDVQTKMAELQNLGLNVWGMSWNEKAPTQREIQGKA